MPSIPGHQIERTLIDGKTMVVYRAVRDEGRRRVLLKTTIAEYPSPLDVQRLKREYETLRGLSFDHHVKPISLERHHQRTVLVLDDPQWPTLAEELARGPLGVPRFLDLAVLLAGVVAELHRGNIIHRDLRPPNVLVDSTTNRILLTGFGLATHASHLRTSADDGMLPDGTLAYLSPEQTGRTHRTVDQRSDLYSLGVTFYEMLTGTVPFTQTDPARLVHAHVALQPPPPADVPAALSQIVVKLLAKDPLDRYQSAHGLKADLERCGALLRTTGTLEAFPLGEQDALDRFHIPSTIYGRTEEASRLLRSFERACAGSSEIILVTGAPGAGKTSLIRQLRARAPERQAYFVEGKFDQMQRSVPYSALCQACRDLIRQILTESEEGVSRWRDRIREEVGPIIQVIVDVVPELAILVGSGVTLPPLPPLEAQNRFNHAWQKFFDVFARETRPLVIFLDDLQWADSASLHLIENRMADTDNRHLLLIGAYRDRDVGASHPVWITLHLLQEQGRTLTRIALRPLDKSELSALVSDTLRLEASDVEGLVGLLLAKTHGNPLAAIETLQLLHRRGLFRFNPERQAWAWDLAEIESIELSESIVDLLVDKIGTLAPRTRDALMLAAGIGDTFDVETLSLVSDRSHEAIIDLSGALEHGLIQFSSELEMQSGRAHGDEHMLSCRFMHDRVRQAAYGLIDEGERPAIHLRIGHALRSRGGALQERLFSVVNHLNLGAGLMDTEQERVHLAQLNLQACRRAKAASAFEVALRFARAGLDLLDDGHWASDYALTLGVHLERAECEYLTGHYEIAEALCDELLDWVRTDADRLAIHNLRIMLYTSRSRYEDAVREGIAAAKLLDLQLPEHPTQVHIMREFLRAKWHLRGMKPDDLMNLPSMVHERQLATVNLLMNLTAPSFLSSEIFAILISLKLFNISLQHGLSKATPYGYMVYAVVNAGLGRAAKAREFGEMALELRDKLEHVEKGHILPFLFATAVNHWTAPASSNVDLLIQGYGASLDAGDLLYAEYCLITIVVNAYFKGETLNAVQEHCDRYLDFVSRVRGQVDTAQRQAESIQRQHIRCLQGLTQTTTSLTDDHFDEAAFLSETRAPLVLLEYYSKKLQLLFHFDETDRIPDLLVRSSDAIRNVEITGDIRLSDYVFYKALALASLPSTLSRRRALRSARRRLRRWAEACPANFRSRHLLVEAEAAHDDRRAMDLYDRAIAAAEAFDLPHIQALANERAARFYERIGKVKIAKTYLTESRYGYAQWGASAKVAFLNDRFASLLPDDVAPDESDTSPLDRLDLASVAKASLAISEEIVLDRLLDRMSTIVIENAGAEKGYLILKEDGRLVVAAEVAVGATGVRMTESVPVEETDLFPTSVVLYVVRTREAVVLDDASREGIFTGDPYVLQHRPKSILCLPLIHQGRLTGALYLENSLSAGVFTPTRLELLRLLTAQLSISVENARLYRNLEEMVAERTEELQTKNEDLESAMRDLKQAQAQLVQAEKLASLGQLTAGIAHEIKNPLNFINNFAGLSIEMISELEDEMADDPDLRMQDVRDLINDLKVNVGKIEEHGRRSDGIVRNMLEHSRATRGERAPTRLNALLREYVGLSYHSIRAQYAGFNAAIDWSLDESDCTIDVVPQEVGRVFLNLLNNAFYAVRERQEREGEGFKPRIRACTRYSEEWAEIRIEDNGAGVPEESRKKIFEPFYTTKPTGEGTGLGLSLSYDIVSNGYRGSLSVESVECDGAEGMGAAGGGAAFMIRLPRGHAARSELEASHASSR